MSDGRSEQFGHPRGLGGQIAGWLMALSNRQLNTWSVDLLGVRPADEVLEIGFGPGLAVQALARRARRGRVAGIDISALMVRQASGRNAAAIRAGQVELREAGVSKLPYPDASFDKVLAVNNVQFWPSLPDDLREVRRVLRPGGALHFVEHGRAPDRAVRRWQERLEPVQRRVAGGCHLTRPVDELLVDAGFVLERLDRQYLPKQPRPFAALYEGVARA